METLSRLCEFGKEKGTAAEKNIFMHIMIDLMESTLNELIRQQEREKHSQRLAQGFSDGKDFEEPYPPEDGPDFLIPPLNLPPDGDLSDLALPP